MKIIQRSKYLDALIRVIGTPDIKVITGIRRCGKSKLMEAFIEWLHREKPETNVVHINFNLTSFEGLLDYHALEDYARKTLKAGVDNLLLIDEVQNCTGFERAINSLHASGEYDIYITGSNAFLLSSDLATLFTGRTYEIPVFPFSFKEFLLYYELENVQAALDRFVLEGGMPGSYLYSSKADKFSYIADVFRTLIIRDIRQKYHIRNLSVFEALTDFMMDNVSNISSIRNISSAVSAGTTKTNDKTIGAYISFLCNAFAFYRVRKYDIRGRRYLSSQDKYYLADHAFRYARLGTKNMDYGRVLENIVAMEFIRRGYELYTGSLYDKEIDFVALRRGEKLYVQVCEDISSPKTFIREAAPLLRVKDAYPKILIARTRHDEYGYEGIQIIDAADWLLQDDD